MFPVMWVSRICGIAALLAAVLGVALTAGLHLTPASVVPHALTLGSLLSVGFLLGLLGVAITQWRGIGKVGRSGFVLVLVADAASIAPAIPNALGGVVAQATSATSAASAAGWIVWAAVVTLAAKLVVGGAASLRSTVLPRWTGAALVVIGLVLLPEVVLFLPLIRRYDAPLYQSLYSFLFTYAYPVLIPAAVDLLWGVVGIALLLAFRSRTATSDSARVHESAGSTATAR